MAQCPERAQKQTHAVQQKRARYSITSSARAAFETGLCRACFDLSDGGALGFASAPVPEFSSI
jgi:hypothetical protein